jgi:hypothetical protein
MNEHEIKVKEIENTLNMDREKPLQLEIAIQIFEEGGQRQIYPGIQINIPGSDIPLFITVGELQLLAESANKHCTELMNKSTNKKKKTP